MDPQKTSITVFRHGDSDYKQGNTPITSPECADDISDDKVLLENSRLLCRELNPEHPVKILSSPTGRCLSSAKVICKVFKDEGFTLIENPESEWEVTTNDDLMEVRDFDYNLFLPLVTGGNFKHEGTDYVMNRRSTNPDGLDSPDYFLADVIQRLLRTELFDDTPEYKSTIQKFESSASCVRRIFGVFQTCLKEPEIQWILVTHDALISPFARVATRNKTKVLPKGSWVLLQDDLRKGLKIESSSEESRSVNCGEVGFLLHFTGEKILRKMQAL